MDHRAAGDLDILARDDDVRPVGKRTPERLPGFAAHDDRMARRHGLEMPEVLGNVPQQGVPVADNAVFGDGYDQTYHNSKRSVTVIPPVR